MTEPPAQSVNDTPNTLAKRACDTISFRSWSSRSGRQDVGFCAWACIDAACGDSTACEATDCTPQIGAANVVVRAVLGSIGQSSATLSMPQHSTAEVMLGGPPVGSLSDPVSSIAPSGAEMGFGVARQAGKSVFGKGTGFPSPVSTENPAKDPNQEGTPAPAFSFDQRRNIASVNAPGEAPSM